MPYKILVTVGTTKFDDLIKKINQINFDKIFENGNFENFDSFEITVQKGNGEAVPKLSDDNLRTKIADSFDYTKNLKGLITSADLVISHAGAGTILEVLESRTKLIAVINEKLMDNHQLELAEKMAQENFCQMSYLKDLEEKISVAIDSEFEVYESGPGLKAFGQAVACSMFG